MISFTRMIPAAIVALMLFTISQPVGAAQATSTGSGDSVDASGDFAGLVDIGDGRRLYLECTGSGSPTVILEAGYRSPATVWTDNLYDLKGSPTMVLAGVGAFTHVCAYERPGVAAYLDGVVLPSRSDPAPMPRSAEDVVADLHALLAHANIQGPSVLVGHSFGGLFVRLYASTYPDEVVGMVLVDALSEDIETLLTPDEWTAYAKLNAALPPEFAGYPAYETIDFPVSFAQMRQAAAQSPLRPMPLTVITHGQPFGIPESALGFSPDALEQAWTSAQHELAMLTPDSQFEVATESAHYVQLQQPELVIAAIGQVIRALREPRSLATPIA